MLQSSQKHLRRNYTVPYARVSLLLVAAIASSCQSQNNSAGRSGLEATQSTKPPYFGQSSVQPAAGSSREVSLLSPQSDAPQVRFEPQGDKVTLNLVNVPIQVAAKAIFGDILKSNFSVADGVSGTVTIQTVRPTAVQALVDIFESILKQKGYGIEKKANTFIITGTDQLKTGSIVASDGSGITAGKQARIVPLNYISAKQMAEILRPMAPEGVLQTDERRNILVLTGSNAELEGMLSSIKLFDVDWMRGMAASLFPLESGADPAVLVKQLQSLFNTSTEENDKALVKFIPSRELKAILVIAQRRDQLDRARNLIARLDDAASFGTRQTFVYRVQNRNAKDLAAVLQRSLGSGGGMMAAGNSTTASADESHQDPSANGSSPSLGASAGISVVADESNNSLVIAASRRDYNKLLGVLASLDKMPSQVLIEAVIAEAALNDQLKFGLRYSIGAGNVFKFTNDDGSRGNNTGSAGFTYSGISANFSVVLNALSAVTTVKVLSSPTLTVLDNHTAKLQVGDQVPVISESATSGTTGTTTTSIQMKDTGVILGVTPRISSNGHILLDIEQEVSDVVNTTTSTINSPTIRQRKVSSTVEVGDGQSIVIGGLVQEQQQKTTDSVPVLGKLPIIGAAFRSRNDQAKRTELMIFLRTRIMRDQNDAQAITNEFRAGLNAVSIDRPRLQKPGAWDLLRVME